MTVMPAGTRVHPQSFNPANHQLIVTTDDGSEWLITFHLEYTIDGQTPKEVISGGVYAGP